MKRIQDLIDRGVITTMTIGKSALPYRGIFCFVRTLEPDDRVQGYGPTIEDAIADTLRRLPLSQANITVIETRPVTTTFQMPEPGKVRMPL